ncbi:MAG: hypothetical protein JWP97_608 [Labilithrix sp.]|nr:hypothetical protein [Labilithrix sp.]
MFHLIAKLSPTDERGWLGIGVCHEGLDDLDAALSIYTLGQGTARSARCIVARARVLDRLDRGDDASDVLDHALTCEWSDDDVELLQAERRRLQ